MMQFIKNLWGFGKKIKQNKPETYEDNVENYSPMDGLSSSHNTFTESMSNWKNLFKKKIESQDDEDTNTIDPLSELTTLDQRADNLRKKTLKRAILTVVLLSFGMFMIVVLYKTGAILYRDSQRQEVPTKVQNLKLEISSRTKWQG